MKRIILFLLIFFAFTGRSVIIFAQTPIPTYTYLQDGFSLNTSEIKINGPSRIITLDGRKGLNMASIKSVLELKAHTLNNPAGAVSIWFMCLEDLSSFDTKPGMFINNPHFYNYPFLSDNFNPQDYESANFKLAWSPRYHPSLTVLFGKGSFYEEAFNLPYKACLSVSHLTFKRNKWYQLSLTWDYKENKYALYLNGILISKETQYGAENLVHDHVGNSLFTGNPTLVMSTIKFYDRTLAPEIIYKSFRTEATKFSLETEQELRQKYNGRGLGKFNWRPDSTWQEKLSIDFNKPSDLNKFYVQGNPVQVKSDKNGLLIETIDKMYTGKLLDSQVYVWSDRPFEGDLYVEYEFKVLRPGGLSLLMVQASGMNREDFMFDYPLRKSGRMKMVYGEDVRNYHWEYYREMPDMRNDVANSALMKNPFSYPLSYNAMDETISKNTWHKLQFLQIGNHLIGAIDGVKMVEFTDDGFNNNGPVYNYGRIAIRCMLHTKMLFRNLKVYNANAPKSELIPIK